MTVEDYLGRERRMAADFNRDVAPLGIEDVEGVVVHIKASASWVRNRIVLNAFFRMGHGPGGFRVWWQALTGSEETLDNGTPDAPGGPL